MAPKKSHVRLWYASCVAVAAPWWMLAPIRFYAPAYGAALLVAALATPRVTLGRRAAGLVLALGLTVFVWVAIIFYIGSRYGDAELQEESRAFARMRGSPE